MDCLAKMVHLKIIILLYHTVMFLCRLSSLRILKLFTRFWIWHHGLLNSKNPSFWLVEELCGIHRYDFCLAWEEKFYKIKIEKEVNYCFKLLLKDIQLWSSFAAFSQHWSQIPWEFFYKSKISMKLLILTE